ncbi:longitudinals lacking -like, partial [Olea europaea subsp. europaea]
MAAGGKSFHLRWNNHLTNLRSLLETLYNDQNLVDVTLSCCDGTLKAHKLMLSACSPYFETIFKSHEVEHPVVILKGISKKEMKSLIDYMYVGSLEVSEDELPNLLQVANELQIKGLIQKPKSPSGTSDPEDDVEMEQSKTPEEVESPPKEQTFRNVTQYGGGMVQPEVESEPSKELSEDKEEPMNVAQDGEIIQPATNGSPTMNNNNNNNNNGQVKTTTQSQYIGHCLEVALNQPELQCRICKR